MESSAQDLGQFITRLIGFPGLELDADRPIGEQIAVSSLQLMELAIALEQECGLELPDDIDLRQATPAELGPADAVLNERGSSGG